MRPGVVSAALGLLTLVGCAPDGACAAANPAPDTAQLVAQITRPASGAKLRRGAAPLEVAITVSGDGDLSWRLTACPVGSPCRLVAAGDAAESDAVKGQISAGEFPAPGQVRVLLEASNNAGDHATAEIGLLMPNRRYQLIPLDEGNHRREAYTSLAMDAVGRHIAYSGPLADPQDMRILDRTNGQRLMLALRAYSTISFVMSGDGARLFFRGAFPSGDQGTKVGVGYAYVADGSTHLVAEEARYLFSVDEGGGRVAYQGVTRDGLQYLIWDEQEQRSSQLTHHPRAISTDSGACPRPSGTRPLVSRDGSLVALITSAPLSGGEEEEGVGCRVFLYESATEQIQGVKSFPKSQQIGLPVLRADGRQLSLMISHPTDDGGFRASPALLNLQTGELRDPVVDVGSYASFDSVITGDGRGIVLSSQADLDPSVGNTDGNLELFHYDFGTGRFAQITETVDGVELGRANGCEPYTPLVSDNGGVVAFGFYRYAAELCRIAAPQREESSGLMFRFVRAVRIRPGNGGPVLERLDDVETIAGGTATLSIAASDPDGDPISLFAQQVGDVDVPRGSVIVDHHDGTGTFTWATRPEDVGDHVLRVAAFDEGGGEVWQDVHLRVVPSEAAGPCTGDCSGDGVVTLDELVTAVTIALGTAPASRCPAGDANGDGTITIDEILPAVRHALDGCPR